MADDVFSQPATSRPSGLLIGYYGGRFYPMDLARVPSERTRDKMHAIRFFSFDTLVFHLFLDHFTKRFESFSIRDHSQVT